MVLKEIIPSSSAKREGFEEYAQVLQAWKEIASRDPYDINEDDPKFIVAKELLKAWREGLWWDYQEEFQAVMIPVEAGVKNPDFLEDAIIPELEKLELQINGQEKLRELRFMVKRRIKIIVVRIFIEERGSFKRIWQKVSDLNDEIYQFQGRKKWEERVTKCKMSLFDLVKKIDDILHLWILHSLNVYNDCNLYVEGKNLVISFFETCLIEDDESAREITIRIAPNFKIEREIRDVETGVVTMENW